VFETDPAQSGDFVGITTPSSSRADEDGCPLLSLSEMRQNSLGDFQNTENVRIELCTKLFITAAIDISFTGIL
jgi:hypothetical protein